MSSLVATGTLKDRVRGMFFGVAVGDALGLPFECRKEPYQRVTNYVTKEGQWSDDTQLTLAVAAAMVDGNGIDLNTLRKRHIEAYKQSTMGWGRSTTAAVEQMIKGNFLPPVGFATGTGNGIAMKVGPVGAYLTRTVDPKRFLSKIADLAMLTHPTSMAVSSGFAQAFAVRYCLLTPPSLFDNGEFTDYISEASETGKNYLPTTLGKDDITARLRRIDEYSDAHASRIAQDFGSGTPYVYNSLPFSYAFFLRNPHSIESLYDVVSAGGDADTNASIVGALLGALHGISIFPPHLLRQLSGTKVIWDWANWFCEKFELD